ncbi:non-hydrolyzing UDP-N-acetylglucosamine 2-epimerase [Natronoarchaeum rubrum]|uniref:non-hydrolyzing UDP-N-acetylglucosamine 2-epimerase n=1 Tax=Natronoarchaeum rubrum TaxID=755311 RepID=UPI0021130A11|nr:UDP-N-acetylglucosamine 2-epimerase (non-hydrolyzing) [Natronoarchaeum rubrum]
MNVLSIVGARPQFVKAAAVSRQLREDHDETLVHTGQHYDAELSDVFFEELAIPEPDHNLGVGSDTHAAQTAEMMVEIERVVADADPDVVLVYGDTNSTLAGALVAAKETTPLAHVEAGLRSGDFSMPEEINRVLTDHCSDLLFAPTAAARENLEHEGIAEGVSVPGDVMYDTLLGVRDRLDAVETIAVPDVVDSLDEFVLATVHRAKNTDDPDRIAEIVDGLADCSSPVVFPAHPRTVAALQEFDLWERATEGIEIVDPVGYLSFVGLVERARCVATDSGGVQKEAFYLDTPCVTLRDTTEWTETVDAGWNRLVGADAERIVDAVDAAGDLPPKPDLYGNGTAASRIVRTLESEVER